MVEAVYVGSISYFLPIFAFLLVFIVIFAILKRSVVLGENDGVNLFISFILASFFIVESQLVDYVAFTSSWVGVFVVILFFLLLTIAVLPGKDPFEFLGKNNWFRWVVMVLMIVFFIIASSYIFNWAVNWDYFWDKTDSDWFGFILLIVIGGAVSWILTRGNK